MLKLQSQINHYKKVVSVGLLATLIWRALLEYYLDLNFGFVYWLPLYIYTILLIFTLFLPKLRDTFAFIIDRHINFMLLAFNFFNITEILQNNYSAINMAAGLCGLACSTLAIISRQFLNLYSIILSLIYISLAVVNLDSKIVFLYWSVSLITVVVSYVFSAERIKNLDQLHESYDRLKVIHNDLEKAIQEKTQIAIQMQSLYNTARQVSHDIRSPLMALEMVSGSLQTQDTKKKDVILKATKRISEICQGMLQVHRSLQNCQSNADQKITLDINRVTHTEHTHESVATIINQVIGDKRVTSTNMNTEIRFSSQGQEIYTDMSPSDLYRIISNIINNSIDSFDAKRDGLIEISLQENIDQVIIKIQDNGKGIPLNLQSHLFTEGFTHGKVNGNGLGLSGARKLLKQSGGDVLIHSNENTGTVVDLIVPKNQSNLEKHTKVI